MMSSFIPDAIARFVVEKVDSVAQLEALLILRNGPEEQWSVQAMAKRLYIDEEQTVKLLADICANGLAITIGGTPTRYQYQPNSDDLRQMVDTLAETYAKHLVPITNLIHSKAKPRIQEFADAFKFRKDK